MKKVLNVEIRILDLFRLPAAGRDLGFIVKEWA